MIHEENAPQSGLTIAPENILVRAKAISREDIIEQLGTLLERNGYVKDTYTQAVLDREKVFPTGLQTNILGFAIPHTDTEHVYKSAVAIAILTEPVVFQAMDSPLTDISVNVVMMLAISDPKAVVMVLRQVISILEDEAALQALLRASTPAEIREIVNGHMQRIAAEMPQEPLGEMAHA
jgi:galactitol PTS system EIIA component